MFLGYVLKNWFKKLDLLLKFITIFLLEIYNVFLSGFLGCGGGCRFYPSCGKYALLVYKKHSFLKASRLIFFRLLNCHPFGPKWRNEKI